MHTNNMKSFLTKNQLLLLRLFYTNPEKSFYMQEIGKILGKKPGTFQRTLNTLVREGILESEYQANARYFRVNTKNMLYPEFQRIIAKSAGVEGSLKDLVNELSDIRIAILYGSFAKGTERKDSDIDLLIVGNPNTEDELLRRLKAIEKSLQREINYKLYSEREYKEKRESKDLFLEEVLSDKTIILKGDPNAKISASLAHLWNLHPPDGRGR